jgi:hypothetical protein
MKAHLNPTDSLYCTLFVIAPTWDDEIYLYGFLWTWSALLSLSCLRLTHI